ncbi:MAG: tetratricopeptide repeat protein [Pyrinomonadaceae bacterium]
MHDIVQIDLKPLSSRVIVVVIAAGIVFGACIAIRWQLSEMLANITRPSDPQAAEIASVVFDWTPNSPRAVWLKAAMVVDAEESLRLYEQSVRASPYEPRWRIDLARAYEQNSRTDLVEEQLKRAIELAPAHAVARWHLGNYYLRQNRISEAEESLRAAASKDPEYRDQVYSLGWDYFNGGAAEMERLAGDEPEPIAYLAYFFASRGRPEEALRNWNRLDVESKNRYSFLVPSMAQGLFEQRHFAQALAFLRQSGEGIDTKGGAVTNGSFESPLGGAFGWNIARNDSRFEAAQDSRVKREGQRSLRLVFKSYSKPAFANVFQTVVIEPNTSYRLRFWLRTEDLRSAGGPLLELINANDGTPIARTRPFPLGTNDWQEVTVDFRTSNGCAGVGLQTIRTYCGEDCPLVGTMWYDDFELTKQ